MQQDGSENEVTLSDGELVSLINGGNYKYFQTLINR